jgi:diguanylate cyclase (GGDEF)-like protein
VALDVGTLMAALVVVCAVVACLLAVTWAQDRDVLALGTWTICFVLCGAAAALAAARGLIPNLGGVDAANTLRLLAFGLAWRATRHFTGRSGNWALVFAPAVLWLAVSLLSGFGEDYRLRVLVGSPLVAAFSFAMAGELLLVRSRRPWVAGPAAILLAFHGLFYLARFLAVLSPAASHLQASLGDPLNSIAMLETLVVAIVLGFLFLSGAKDEVLLHYRRAALVDPLTGVSNRRGFEAEAKRMLARAVRDGTSTALLLLDLDHFKTVNDKWGHLAGDAALRQFASTVATELRGGDLLARLGGEEFAVALADCMSDQAEALAERIRSAVAALRVRAGAADICLTVSIGVASIRDTDSLDALLKEADSALYRAKAGGRDRVESALRGRVLAGVRWVQEGSELRRVA